MLSEPKTHILQATALVHEAWLRLGADQQPEWANRAHFFSSAAEAMHRILVDAARHRKAKRHGGNHKRIEVSNPDQIHFHESDSSQADIAIIELNEALVKLSELDAETAELVKLHYLLGLTHEEMSDQCNMSKRTICRRLSFARAWLRREMERL
jgi:RNA polymerase sigma factor (TIGR02999 family)